MENLFPFRLKELRMLADYTQDELAKKIGLKKSSIVSYENGSRTPSFVKLIELAKVLNTSTDYLLGMTDIKNPDQQVKVANELPIVLAYYLKALGKLDDQEITTLRTILESLIARRKFKEDF